MLPPPQVHYGEDLTYLQAQKITAEVRHSATLAWFPCFLDFYACLQ